ncbi:MAG TPA: hypothetical protein VF708_08220 [Pyrinomonadaceae bacterium]|jgi:hypothetical protein
MAEEKESQDKASTTPEARENEAFEFDVSEAGELVFKDSSGRTITLKPPAEALKRQQQQRERKPLTPDQFRDGLQRLKALGLTWTADRTPQIKAKDKESENAFFTDEYQKIQSEYPHLPSEVSAVVFHALTRSPAPEALVGSKDVLEGKVSILYELQIINADYSSEFFFKNAIKVPYFSSIDWEVVFKTFEKSVFRPLTVPYALLALTLEYPEGDEGNTITVAVNLDLLNQLINTLSNVKKALERTRELTNSVFDVLSKLEVKADGSTEPEKKQLE